MLVYKVYNEFYRFTDLQIYRFTDPQILYTKFLLYNLVTLYYIALLVL